MRVLPMAIEVATNDVTREIWQKIRGEVDRYVQRSGRDILGVALSAMTSARQVIGDAKSGRIPWDGRELYPEDYPFFLAASAGCATIHGGKSMTALGLALPGRVSLVLTRNKNFQLPLAGQPVDLQNLEPDHFAAHRPMAQGEGVSQGRLELVFDYPQALKRAREITREFEQANPNHFEALGYPYFIICGGALVYQLFIENNETDLIIATMLARNHPGDVFFPEFKSNFRCIHRVARQGYAFEAYLRIL